MDVERTFWLIPNVDNSIVVVENGFIPIDFLWDASTIHFYGTAKYIDRIVGVVFHSTMCEMLIPDLSASMIEGAIFPVFLFEEIQDFNPEFLIDGAEEMFGDVSLWRDSRGRYGFRFDHLQPGHLLYEPLSQAASQS